ncbi:MAG: hypothetical protein O3C67_04995 [Cyanobacteria bacterium]|nr:hypothetical protein [Cyanobacteriota bacterium]
MDELKLELQNRAISRAAVGMSTTAQVAAVASALCWPVGLWVGGWLGVAALASAAVLVMGGTVAAIDEEIKAIEAGDKVKIKGWLTEGDVLEAMERHGLGGAAESPKIQGTSGQAPTESPSSSDPTQTAPTAGSEASSSAGALPRGVLALRPETHLKLLAPSRGGKTNTLLHLLREAKRVTYVTLKDSDRVPQHWRGYRLRPFNIHRDVAAVLSEVQATVGAILDGTDRGEHWLVVDEALAITDLLQASAEDEADRATAREFSSLIKLHLATGAAQGARLALMSQTQNGTDIKGISAASLQNLWTVVCGSERCAEGLRHLVPWYQKHVGGLTAEQVAELRALTTGFYQLASVKGEAVLCAFPQFVGDLQPCGVPGAEETVSSAAPAASDATDPEPKSLPQRISDYLQRHGEAKTAREVRGACTRPTDTHRATVDEVRTVLAAMVAAGEVQQWDEGNTARYQSTGQSPERCSEGVGDA